MRWRYAEETCELGEILSTSLTRKDTAPIPNLGRAPPRALGTQEHSS